MSSSTRYGPRSWGLPLLAKDLTELAARPRTYYVRIFYAITLILISLFALVGSVSTRRLTATSVLGTGSPVLSTLILLEELGLYLVMPVLAGCVLTVEKERRTLDLLLLTRLGSWTIISEKFLSVLLIAINFLLLSLPVLAFSYSLGGIEHSDLGIAVLELLLTSIRITAVGVFCSALCDTSGRALAVTYQTLVAVFLIELATHAAIMYITTVITYGPSVVLDVVQHSFYDPGFVHLVRSNLWLAESTESLDQTGILMGCLSSLVFSGAFLVSARWILVPPAWARRRQAVKLAQRQSRTESASEARTPDFDDPVSWREAPRGNPLRWWVRSCLKVSTPVIVVLAFIHLTNNPDDAQFLSMCVSLGLWLMVTLKISTQACCLITTERTSQTLDILRTTPLSAKKIVEQKMEQVKRTIYLSRVALGTCAVFRALINPNSLFLIGATLTIWMYPILIAWVSLACGATAKNGAVALLRSLLMLAAWCVLPLPVFVVSPIPLLVITEYFGTRPLGHVLAESSEVTLMFGLMILLTPMFQWLRTVYSRNTVLDAADFWIRTVPVKPNVTPDRWNAH